jgi:hypothetical protein
MKVMRHILVGMTAVLFLAGCSTASKVPHKDQYLKDGQLPIDGVWAFTRISTRTLKYKIENQKMTITRRWGILPAGTVLAKNITPIDSKTYTCEVLNYARPNPTSPYRIVGYGPGRVEVLSETLFTLRYFPNPKLGFYKEVTENYEKVGNN